MVMLRLPAFAGVPFFAQRFPAADRQEVSRIPARAEHKAARASRVPLLRVMRALIAVPDANG